VVSVQKGISTTENILILIIGISTKPRKNTTSSTLLSSFKGTVVNPGLQFLYGRPIEITPTVP